MRVKVMLGGQVRPSDLPRLLFLHRCVAVSTSGMSLQVSFVVSSMSSLQNQSQNHRMS